jgi:hypothetical protein
MARENELHSESSEASLPPTVLAAIAAAGLVTEVVAAVSENRNPSGSLPTVLMYAEAIICLFVIAATIETGTGRSPRKLLVASAGVIVTALISVALVGAFSLGGHTSAAFGWLYFVWTCAICGLSLLIVAVVRFVAERRKQRPSAIE